MTTTTTKVAQTQSWDAGDLQRRLCHALDIASQAVERLVPSGYTDEKDPSNNVRSEKVIFETSLLLYAAATVKNSGEINDRIKTLTELLLPYARSKKILLGICTEPSIAWDYALAHVLLKKLGHHDATFDAALEQVTRSRIPPLRERTPYRMLEQEWIRDLWQDSRNGNGHRSSRAARSSALGQPMDLLSGTREDIYAFTHAAMYVSDFNIRPRRLPRSRRAILSEAEAALAFCLDEQDYDLGGEVLLTWPLTGKSWTPAAVFGLRVLANVEDQAGFLPAPSTRLDRLNKLEGDERTDYLLATAYHTAYVMGLLCAAALQPGRIPPTKVPARGYIPGSAAKILPFLGPGRGEQHWWDQLDQLNERQRDAVAGLLFNIGLRRKVKDRDFGGLHQLLATGYELGLANNAAASQAAEMLHRLSIFADAGNHRAHGQ